MTKSTLKIGASGAFSSNTSARAVKNAANSVFQMAV
jgi:hypothetical protein